MPSNSRITYWAVAGAAYLLFADQLLWRQFGPWVDGGGYMPALTLPGFEPPPVGLAEYHEVFLVRLLYRAPYLAYALACTVAAARAIWLSHERGLRPAALAVVSALFLTVPWIAHWAICLALPSPGTGCFEWGGGVELIVFLLPKIVPLAAMAVVIAQLENWLTRPTA